MSTMSELKTVLKETLPVAACEFAVAGVTVAVFALMKKTGTGVWLGSLAGALLAALNFFVMALGASKAASKAASEQDVQGGQAAMRVSYIFRYVAIFAILAVLARLGAIDPLAAIFPLLLMQPIIILTEYFLRKAGDK